MHILDTIIEHKKEEVRRLKRFGLKEPPFTIPPIRDLYQAIKDPPMPAIIAEVKRASPSKGVIVEDFRPVETARFYEENGARAVSVLTDERFFKGSLEYLAQIKTSVGLPCLRKDFLIDHCQVEESLFWGADAILLIVAAIDPALLKELFLHAREKGLSALVEVHNEEEAERALELGARIIGINNRDLKDFTVSIHTTLRVMEAMKGARDKILVVSESGIKDDEAFITLRDHGVDAVLIGEGFMREPKILPHFVGLSKG